ncbi:MAG: hypothetical protein ABI134_08495 [Byssovorax sp.]
MRNRIVTAGFIAAVAAVAYGCGGSDTTPTGTTGDSTTSTTSSTSSGTGGMGGGTTSSSSASSSSGTGGGTPIVCTPPDGTVLAIDTLDFGDVDKDTTKSQMLGFDIDSLVSTAQSADLCLPADGGSKNTVYPDGDKGIDNSFGKNVLPLLLNISPGFSAATTDSIANGAFTMMFDFVGLDAANPSPASLVTRLYGGTDMGTPPSFDGTDCWPVAPELLKTPADITSSTVVFDKSTIVVNKWDSGPAGQVTLTIPVGAATISLTMNAAKISLDLAPDRKSATGGRIGGVLDTEEFIKEIKKAVFSLQGNAGCQLIKLVNAEKTIRQASDILSDGTQNTAMPCNGISIGFGFTMKAVQLGGVGPKTPPAAGTCP